MKVYTIEKFSPLGDLLGRTYYRTQAEARRGLRLSLLIYKEADRLEVVNLGRGYYYVWNPRTLRGWFLKLMASEIPDNSSEARFLSVKGEGEGA